MPDLVWTGMRLLVGDLRTELRRMREEREVEICEAFCSLREKVSGDRVTFDQAQNAASSHNVQSLLQEAGARIIEREERKYAVPSSRI